MLKSIPCKLMTKKVKLIGNTGVIRQPNVPENAVAHPLQRIASIHYKCSEKGNCLLENVYLCQKSSSILILGSRI